MNFSEFSYGYALTEKLISWAGTALVAAPIFPSLIEEGQTGGYDLNLTFPGIVLFLQFKLSRLMGKRASEYRKRILDVPFYRVELRTGVSRQHELLLKLEKSYKWVYYVAPTFHEVADLNDAYLKGQILDRSILVAPSAIGPLPDAKPHHLSRWSKEPLQIRRQEPPVLDG